MASPGRIAVVGAGLMGHGIAQVFACAGYEVAIADADAATLASVPERVRENLDRLGADPAAADAIRLCAELEDALDGADVAFEAAPENLALKRELFARMSAAAPEGVVLATNTSAIPIGEIATAARDPGRVVGTHWWNPPYLIPLVEVIEAETTQIDTVTSVMVLLETVGKSPVHVRRDIPGFVGNRLQHALWREAFALVEAGVCDAESIDRVVRDGFGLRLPVLGPMENADLVGLDLTLAIHETLIPSLDRTPGPAAILRERVAEGSLGMKAGRGFRDWPEGAAARAQARLVRALPQIREVQRAELPPDAP